MLAKSEQRQYTMTDSFVNVTLGTLVGTGLHLTFSKVGDFYKAKTGKENIYKDIAEAPPELREDLVKYALGRMMSGKKVNAAEFIEHTKLRGNREMKLQDWIQIQDKSSFQINYDLDSKIDVKDLKSVANLKKEIDLRIEAKLSPIQKKELEKLKLKLSNLNKKLKKKGIEQKEKQDIDIEIVNKDKTLIPVIAKINKLNKQATKIKEQGENSIIRELIEQDQIKKGKQSSISQSTLNKVQELNEIYSKRTPLEGKRDNVLKRIEKIEEDSKFEIYNKEKDSRLNQSAEYELNINDMILPLKEIDRTKTLNVDDIKKLNDEINDVKSQLEIKDSELRENSEMNKHLNEFNKEISDIDKITNRQKDFFKAIQAGFACVFRGR